MVDNKQPKGSRVSDFFWGLGGLAFFLSPFYLLARAILLPPQDRPPADESTMPEDLNISFSGNPAHDTPEYKSGFRDGLDSGHETEWQGDGPDNPGYKDYYDESASSENYDEGYADGFEFGYEEANRESTDGVECHVIWQ